MVAYALMHKCPKCFALLAYLERRIKYYCSKCRKAYPKLLIEANTFRIYNRFQRNLDRENLQVEIEQQKRPKLSPEERKERNKQKRAIWMQNNKERVIAFRENYYELHKDEFVARKRAYRANMSEEQKKQENENRKRAI